MLRRRQLVMGAAATVGSAMISPLAAAPFEWLRTSPSDAGFASDIEARLDKLIADKRVWGLHGVLVIHAGASCWNVTSKARTTTGASSWASCGSAPTPCKIFTR